MERQLDVLSEEQALHLLADRSGAKADSLPVAARKVARQCGRLPLALAVCGEMVRDGNRWEGVLEALREADLAFLDRSPLGYQYPNLLRSLHVGVEFLAPPTLMPPNATVSWRSFRPTMRSPKRRS